MNKTFYREESIEYQCSRCLGKTLEVKPTFCAWLIAVVVLTAVAIGIFLWLGEYTRKNYVEGSLVSDKGLTKVYTLQIDSLIVRDVQEEQLIKKGRLLVVSAEHKLLERAGFQVLTIKKLKNRPVTSQLRF
jgi:membrane fusion protein